MTKLEVIPRKTVMRIGIISELLIALAALGWIYIFDTPISFSVSPWGFALGLLASLPMLAFNIFVFSRLSSDTSPWPVYNRFKRSIIIPLCGDLTIPSAILLSTLAGVAEELLFRGALQSQITIWSNQLVALILVNALFSYVHFAGMVRAYWQLTLIYFLFGLYFSAISLSSGNLFAAMVVHGFYNFVVIVYLLRFEISVELKNENSGEQH